MVGYANQPLTRDAAEKLIRLSLQDKEITSWEKIGEWFTATGGRCYVSFSGGKDSTVLAYLVAKWLSSFRQPPYPLRLVFCNTGLEYPEIQKFVNEYAAWLQQKFSRIAVELVRVHPKLTIRQVLTQYGYPVVSKEVASCVSDAKRNPDGLRMKRLRGEDIMINGTPSQYNCEKWYYLLDAPFRVSDKCCNVTKKAPLNAYARRMGLTTVTATMADESRLRMTKWLKTGCNAFDGKRPVSKPMSFWTEQDVLHFIVENNIPHCSVYGDIVASDGDCDYDKTLINSELHCTGCNRTGCMFCAFGAHLEKGETRFERMKRTHPKHYDFCIGGGEVDAADGMWKPSEKGLGFAKVLDFIGVMY